MWAVSEVPVNIYKN